MIYRSLDGKNFEPIGTQLPGTHRYSDFLGKTGVTAQYKVAASDRQYRQSPMSSAVSASTREFTDDELLTMLQEACFHYYWDGADPHSGMTRENIPGDDRMVATGASGFGMLRWLSALTAASSLGNKAVERLTKIVSFLENAQRYHGAWSHYMDGNTGKTMPVFGTFDNGGDLVETSFLMQGLLAARQYFHGDNEKEQALYGRITQLWETVEWDWYRETASQRLSLLALVVAVGVADSSSADRLQRSDDHVSARDVLADAWRARGYVLLRLGGTIADCDRVSRWLVGRDRRRSLRQRPHLLRNQARRGRRHRRPLFFTHYSYIGFDPHSLHDRYTSSYFDNNRNLALINRAYSIANPKTLRGLWPECVGTDRQRWSDGLRSARA